jgi:hypothetical protein
MRPQTILTASLVAAGLALPLSVPALANIVITVDKSTQHMTVAVDGAARYEWAVSTGRGGYDTPNGTFRPNRMDADHMSQEWDNAPMPHSIFFDLKGHAIHGFFDTKHLGLPVSHGCVRLTPAHAAALFDLVKAEGMSQTTVIVTGQIPAGGDVPVARRPAPSDADASPAPMPIAPDYGQQPEPSYGQPAYGPPAYGQPAYGQRAYGQPTYGQPAYGQPTYGPPAYGQPAYRQPSYGQSYYSGQPYGGQLPQYVQPEYGQPVYRQW